MTPETPEIPGLQTGDWSWKSWKENCIQQRQGKRGGGVNTGRGRDGISC